MRLAARLDRVLPALTVRERVSLTLRAQAAGDEPDPQLSRLSSLEERKEYDRYVALIIAANVELGTLVQALAIALWEIASRLDDADLLREAAALSAEQEGSVMPDKPVRNWRSINPISTPFFLCGVAEDIQSQLRDQLKLRWQEVRALEILWTEIAAEFGGADPRHPELKAKADELSADARELATRLFARPRKAPEPTDEVLAGMRERVDRAFGYLGLIETKP